MISFNKEEIDSMLLIQQNFAKILLAYIEKLVSSSNNVDVKYSDDMIKILENLKKSLEHCNENIASLQSINEDSDMEITNKIIVDVNKKTIHIEDFLYDILPFSELKFSKDEPTEEKTEVISEPDTNNLTENTLIISETKGKVILPYLLTDLEAIKEKNPSKTFEEIVRENYTLPIENFKTPFVARFREAFKLAYTKEKKSIKYAFDLGTELLFNYNLHPAIIAGCRNLDELDIYLDYLENSETEKFDCFKIVFEIPPVLKKS